MKKFVIYLITIFCALDANSLNPAYQNYPNNYFVQCQFNARILNNTLNLSQYYRHFNHNSEWDYTQKSDILNLLPDSGITINADLAYNYVNFSSPMIDGSINYRQLIYAYSPKDLIDLTLFGNDLHRLYDISDFSHTYLKYYDIALGFRYLLINNEIDKYDNRMLMLSKLKLGLKIHWLKGKSITTTDSSFGSVYTTPNTFIGQVKLFQSTAQGGNGFSFDIGTMIKFQPPITFGLAVLNLNTGLIWNKLPQQKFLEIEIDSFSLQRYIELGSIDSLYRKTDTIISNTSFRTSLPVSILLETSYPIISRNYETESSDDILTINFAIKKYLSNNRLTIDYQNSINIAFVWKLSDFFTTKHSLTNNFHSDYIIGHNFVFSVKNFITDLSISQQNGYFTNAKGISASLSLGYFW